MRGSSLEMFSIRQSTNTSLKAFSNEVYKGVVLNLCRIAEPKFQGANHAKEKKITKETNSLTSRHFSLKSKFQFAHFIFFLEKLFSKFILRLSSG